MALLQFAPSLLVVLNTNVKVFILVGTGATMPYYAWSGFKIQDHEKNSFGGVGAKHLYIVCLQKE